MVEKIWDKIRRTSSIDIKDLVEAWSLCLSFMTLIILGFVSPITGAVEYFILAFLAAIMIWYETDSGCTVFGPAVVFVIPSLIFLAPIAFSSALSSYAYRIHDKYCGMSLEEKYRATLRMQANPETAKRCSCKILDSVSGKNIGLILTDIRWADGPVTMWCPNCQSYGTYAENFMDLLHKYRD